MGMGMEEFLALTPRHLDRLWKAEAERHKATGWRGELMLAQLTAMVANTGFKGWEEARQPKEFLLRDGTEPVPRKSRKRKLEEMEMQRSIWKALAKQGGTYVEAKVATT
jgi:hypothetical protein